MKSIKMSDLKVGDVFTTEVKLHGREAFVVNKINTGSFECISRSTNKFTNKQVSGNVIFLRHIDEYIPVLK